MNPRCEVAVIGAGPAGSAAALLLARRGTKVLLLDRARFPRSKVCGGCLSARALEALAALGLGGLPAGLGAVPTRAVRLAASGRIAELEAKGGAVLSRTALDAALVEAAVRAGARFEQETEARLGPTSGGARVLRLRGPGGRESELSAGLVLAADGLGCRLLQAAGEARLRAMRRSRVGAGALLDGGPDLYDAGVVTMACGRHGYLGLARLEDGRLDAAAAFRPDFPREAGGLGAAARDLLAEAGLPSIPGIELADWRGTGRLSVRPLRPWAERVLVLGDAAGYREPFTGEGIAWALESAFAAAPLAERAARAWEPGIGREWEGLHARVVRRNQRVCGAVARVLRHPSLTTALVGLLARRPGLAAPVLARIGRTSA